MHASLLVMERVLIIGWKRLPIVDIQLDLAYLQLSIIVASPNVFDYQRYPIDFKQSPRYLGRINNETASIAVDREAEHYDSIQNLYELEAIACVYRANVPHRKPYVPE